MTGSITDRPQRRLRRRLAGSAALAVALGLGLPAQGQMPLGEPRTIIEPEDLPGVNGAQPGGQSQGMDRDRARNPAGDRFSDPDGPADSDAATAPPISILPGPNTPEPAETPMPPSFADPLDPMRDIADGVQMGPLAQPDPSAVGTLQDDNGGFGWEMWQGSNLTLVKRLMTFLPAPSQSPVLQDLSRRLLLSAARVPQARSGPEPGASEPTLLEIRVARLAAAGDLTATADLLAQTTPFSMSTMLEEQRANVALLTDDRATACDLATQALQQSGAAYWLKLSAYCDAVDGAADAAARTLTLLEETGEADAGFTDLLSQIIGGQTGTLPDSVAMRDLSPLTFSMLQSLDIPFTSDILLTSNALILTATAEADNVPAPVRLAALEQAAGFGALPLGDLRRAYADFPVSANDKAAALDRAAAGGGAEVNALLYQAIAESTDAATRIDRLKAALDLARRQGHYALTANALLPAARSVEPTPQLIESAGPIVRALLMAGGTDRAHDWYNVVRRAANGDNMDATGALLDIWPLFHLAERDTGVPYSEDVLDLWWQAQAARSASERMARGRMLFSLLEALDYTIPDTFWIAVIDTPLRSNDTTPALPVWRAGLSAAAAGRVGETVLAGLVGLGNDGLGVTSLSAISSIVAQYREVGLQPDANRIAVETAILQGL